MLARVGHGRVRHQPGAPRAQHDKLTEPLQRVPVDRNLKQQAAAAVGAAQRRALDAAAAVQQLVVKVDDAPAGAHRQ